MSGCFQKARTAPELLNNSFSSRSSPAREWLRLFLFRNVCLWFWLCLVERMRDWLKTAALCRLHLVKKLVPNFPSSISVVFRFGRWDSWGQLGVTKPRDASRGLILPCVELWYKLKQFNRRGQERLVLWSPEFGANSLELNIWSSYSHSRSDRLNCGSWYNLCMNYGNGRILRGWKERERVSISFITFSL